MADKARAQRRREEKRRKKQRQELVNVESLSIDEALTRMGIGVETEPLTAELIDELAGAGWSREDLEEARRHGLEYCRERDSLLSAPEFWSGDNDD